MRVSRPLDAVIAQTAMSALQTAKDRRKQQRVFSFAADPRNGSIYFSNEHHQHMYFPRPRDQGLLPLFHVRTSV
jgi:hypothetical protein